MRRNGRAWLVTRARYVQHDSPSSSYLEYRAFAQSRNEEPAGFTTYLRYHKRVFRTHLQCRKCSTHSQCLVCYTLKDAIKYALGVEERQAAVTSHTRHVLAQYLDRHLYWAMRTVSWQFFTKSMQIANGAAWRWVSWLTAILDSAEQAKFKTPRVARVRKMPQLFLNMRRPAMHLLGGCWAKLRWTFVFLHVVFINFKLAVFFHASADRCHSAWRCHEVFRLVRGPKKRLEPTAGRPGKAAWVFIAGVCCVRSPLILPWNHAQLLAD